MTANRSVLSIEISLVAASDLASGSKIVIYDLFDQNMSAVSAGTSMSYLPRTKRSELFHPHTRFLLLTRESGASEGDACPPMPGALPESRRKGKAKASDFELDAESLLGFCSFRFDTESTADDDLVEVIYWSAEFQIPAPVAHRRLTPLRSYELQLSPRARGKGSGKLLMNTLEDIGRRRGMDKAMLTCLKSETFHTHGHRLALSLTWP